MSRGRDFSRLRQQRNVARRGFEAVDGGLPVPGTPPRTRVSKSDQRKLLDDLFSRGVEITRIFQCGGCCHRFKAKQAVVPQEPMLCPRCGRPV